MLTQKNIFLISLPNHYPRKLLSILDRIGINLLTIVVGEEHNIRGIYVDKGSYQKETFVVVVKRGENVGQKKMFSSMPKGENVENSCQLMSKDFNNTKGIISKT